MRNHDVVEIQTQWLPNSNVSTQTDEGNVDNEELYEIRVSAVRATMLACYFNHISSIDNEVWCLMKALELDPDSQAFNQNIGDLMARLGRFGEAGHYYARAIELADEDDPMVYLSYAAQFDMNNIEMEQDECQDEPGNNFLIMLCGSEEKMHNNFLTLAVEYFKEYGELERARQCEMGLAALALKAAGTLVSSCCEMSTTLQIEMCPLYEILIMDAVLGDMTSIE